jgi:hypothetical protein
MYLFSLACEVTGGIWFSYTDLSIDCDAYTCTEPCHIALPVALPGLVAAP